MNAPVVPQRRAIHTDHGWFQGVPVFLLMDTADLYALEQMETAQDVEPEYENGDC